MLTIAPQILEVPTADVYCKQRRRERGGSQYSVQTQSSNSRSAQNPAQDFARDFAQRAGNHLASPLAKRPAKQQIHQIRENGLLFEVDFSSHLDTGLFLDHRQTRVFLRDQARRKNALNLFAYTGSASVYLAAGGAQSVTTLDLSRRYLEVAQRNMTQNGFTGKNYNFEQTDVLRWVKEHRHDNQKFDLIFCDPPTFSNSTSMGVRSWDVQRDHGELLIALSRMLAREGQIVFSTNRKSFTLEDALLIRAGVNAKEITTRTIPPDFERAKGVHPVHRCYVLQRAQK